MPIVSSLHLYPVKSCRVVDVGAISLDRLGPIGDRRWMIVSNNYEGTFVSQRTHPQLAQIEATIVDSATVELNLPDRAAIRASLNETSPIQKMVTIWNSQVVAQDAGDEVSGWLGRFLEKEVRLVGIDSRYQRYVAHSDSCQTGFADAYPLLMISKASLDDLNKRLDFPVEMSRFRPNIVVDDCAPFEEDTWSQIRIGDCRLTASGPCARCSITTVNPMTGRREGKEPLQTLAKYRKTDQGIVFGQNFTNESKSGRIEVGMEIQIL